MPSEEKKNHVHLTREIALGSVAYIVSSTLHHCGRRSGEIKLRVVICQPASCVISDYVHRTMSIFGGRASKRWITHKPLIPLTHPTTS